MLASMLVQLLASAQSGAVWVADMHLLAGWAQQIGQEETPGPADSHCENFTCSLVCSLCVALDYAAQCKAISWLSNASVGC